MKIWRLFAIGMMVWLVPSWGFYQNWHRISSDHYVIFYEERFAEYARSVLGILTAARPISDQVTGHKLSKIVVILEDQGVITNGFANPLSQKMVLWTTPPGSLSFMPQYKSWIELVGVHEETHLKHLLKTTSQTQVFQKLFGNLFSLNLISPPWLIEGIAVVAESKLPNQGRLADGVSEVIVQTQASQNQIPSYAEMTFEVPEWPFSQRYLYGGQFVSYLRNRFGDTVFEEFLSYYSGSFLGLLYLNPVNYASRKVFGQSMETLYQDWVKQLPRKNTKPYGSQITQDGWQKSHPVVWKNQLFYFKTYEINPGPWFRRVHTDLVRLDLKTNQKTVLNAFPGSPVSDLQVDASGHLYFRHLDLKPGYANLSGLGFGYISVVMRLNVETGRLDRVYAGDFRTFTVKNQTIFIASDRVNGGSKVHRLEADGTLTVVVDSDYMISECRLADQDLVFVGKKEGEFWSLHRINLTHRSHQVIARIDGSIRQLSLHGRTVYFSANPDQEWHIYRTHLDQSGFDKMKNSHFSGFSAPFSQDLLYLSVTPKGYDFFQTQPQWQPAGNVFESATESDWTASKPPIFSIESGFLPTLKESTVPSRFFPGLFWFEDGLGINRVQINYAEGGVQIGASSDFLMPIQTHYFYIPSLTQSHNLQVSRPLYRGIFSGVQDITAQLNWNFKDIFRPVLRSDWGWAGAELSTQIGSNLDASPLGHFVDLSGSIYQNDTQLTARLTSIRRDQFIGRVRGTGLIDVDFGHGEYWAIELNQKILEFRKGFYTPALFTSDLFARAFWDRSTIEATVIDDLEETRTRGVGVSLVLEQWLTYGELTHELGIADTPSGLSGFYVIQGAVTLGNR